MIAFGYCICSLLNNIEITCMNDHNYLVTLVVFIITRLNKRFSFVSPCRRKHKYILTLPEATRDNLFLSFVTNCSYKVEIRKKVLFLKKRRIYLDHFLAEYKKNPFNKKYLHNLK